MGHREKNTFRVGTLTGLWQARFTIRKSRLFNIFFKYLLESVWIFPTDVWK